MNEPIPNQPPADIPGDRTVHPAAAVPGGRATRRIRLMLLLLVLAVLVVRAAADHTWAMGRLGREISRQEKRFGPLDPATLAPPTVPPAENRARAMLAAATLASLTPAQAGAANRYLGLVPPGSGAAQPPVFDPAIVEQNREAVRVAVAARRRPKSNWQVDYLRDRAVPPLMDLRNLSLVLRLACRAEIEAGHADQAAEAVMAGLAEASSLQQEPLLIDQLIRIAIAGQQIWAVRDLLERSEPSAQALAELAALIQENKATDPIRAGLIGDLKKSDATLARLEHGEIPDGMTGARTPFWARPRTIPSGGEPPDRRPGRPAISAPETGPRAIPGDRSVEVALAGGEPHRPDAGDRIGGSLREPVDGSRGRSGASPIPAGPRRLPGRAGGPRAALSGAGAARSVHGTAARVFPRRRRLPASNLPATGRAALGGRCGVASPAVTPR
jgi:hypothetical protein